MIHTLMVAMAPQGGVEPSTIFIHDAEDLHTRLDTSGRRLLNNPGHEFCSEKLKGKYGEEVI